MLSIGSVGQSALILVSSLLAPIEQVPTEAWEGTNATPFMEASAESVDVSAEMLEAAAALAESGGSDSLLVAKDGKLIFERYWNGKFRSDLAELDLKAMEVEGVSGATKTSMAMARGVVATARHELLRRENENTDSNVYVAVTLNDLGTGVIIACGLIIGLTRLRSNRYIRIGFPVVLVIFLGFINGDLLSLAMLAGWARSGVPWQTAPGLLMLTVAALLTPIASRRNIYCSHLCPHGAAQQLLRRASRKQVRIPRKVLRGLLLFPGLLLIGCVLISMTNLSFSLVNLEAFDAWVFRIAGAATIAIAIVGLVASFFVPMAYCRFGCPTGFVLNFLRLNARSDEWGRVDWAALVLVFVSSGLWWVG